MNYQLQSLLHDSLAHYRSRQLKKALNSAKIALEFGMSEGAGAQDLIQANLLLASIYNTNGIYQLQPAFQEKALHYISEARRLNESVEDETSEMEITGVSGKIHIGLKDYGSAETCLHKSLNYARKLQHLEGEAMALARLSKLHLEKNELDKGASFAEEGLAFLQKNFQSNHALLWAEIYLQLSQAYIKRQDYSRSLEMSQKLLEICRRTGDVEKEIIALRNIAIVCGVKSNFKIGMQYFLEALTKCENIGYRELLVQIQINTGTLYAQLYNYGEAINRYQSVLNDHPDLLDDKTKVVIYNNLGNIYFTTDHAEEALDFFEKAHTLAVDCQYQEMMAHTLAQSSRTKISLNRLAEARQDAQLAQEIFNRPGDINGKQIHLLNLGTLAYEDKDYEHATRLTENGIENAKRIKDDASEIRGYKLLSSIFKALGKFEIALDYQERYAEIQAEYASMQRQRQFLDMEIRHAMREKQKEIEQLTKENEYQALLLQKSDKIARQNQELLQANEELRQFAYIASHDLKEPLRMIGSYTQVIERLVSQLLDEKGKQYFNFVTDGVQRMNNLLDGLLKYATIGNTEVEKEDVNLNDIIHVSLANLKYRIIETNANITSHELPTIKGNTQLLTQLFQNLIGNALKFVKPGVQPDIQVSASETEEEHILAVSDNGIGISPEHQHRIFEIFHRLHARTQYEGTGIGLAICMKIVKVLNGRLWVQSKEGEGATFYIAIPK